MFLQGKRIVQEGLSSRHHRQRDSDPIEEAFKTTTRRTDGNAGADTERNRGRERTTSTGTSRSSSSIRRTGSRSLSPLRVSDIILDSEQEMEAKSAVPSATSNHKQSISSSASFLSAFSFSRGQKRWRIRDLLLFRSASEGRATDKKAVEEMKNSSFRSVESLSSVSSSRRRGSISAHELHYKTNRAVSEELKRKTSLPYKHGLLGCLRFNSNLQRNFSKGFGSLTRTWIEHELFSSSSSSPPHRFNLIQHFIWNRLVIGISPHSRSTSTVQNLSRKQSSRDTHNLPYTFQLLFILRSTKTWSNQSWPRPKSILF